MNKTQQRIHAFAVEWMTQAPPQNEESRKRDIEFLAACIEEIVDDAVREAILTTANALKERN